MIKKVTILDYGVGNIFNLYKSLERLNYSVNISSNSNKISNSERLIIPGVGAFKEGIENIKKRNLIETIKSYVKNQRPLLGICLGMQYLMSYSEEFGKTDGLKIIKGNVIQFKKSKENRVPHIGWNYLYNNNDKIFLNLKKKPTFYFCHSFYVNPKNKKNKLSETKYSNINFCSAIKKENIYGCQFHPERSGKNGEVFLKNFMSI